MTADHSHGARRRPILPMSAQLLSSTGIDGFRLEDRTADRRKLIRALCIRLSERLRGCGRPRK